jgi:1-aminocyclopropane-1-carboxylate deaminase/D-cysteine desulfhydrase-like pyridoxal-dependent ACC family enzyme
MIAASVPLMEINSAFIAQNKVRLYMLRLDLNHQNISGNKWYKLFYNIEQARKENKSVLLTFGGAYSNHIAATAAAGKEYGFKTIGIIRGEEQFTNATLLFAQQNEMQLHFVSRALYQKKEELYNYVANKFAEENFYLIPEGGSNHLGMLGCKEIKKLIDIDFDYICCACGTGATLSGIILSLQKEQQALGFQVLKASNYIQYEVEQQLKGFPVEANWSINENYHFGGYAKIKTDLTEFVRYFKLNHHIPLDFIYTGKMMFGIFDLIEKGYFKKGSTIVAVHTGGLQGNVGFEL